VIPKGYSADTHQVSREKQVDGLLKNETLTSTSITLFERQAHSFAF